MRVALIHAVDIAIEPVRQAFEQYWPQADLVHLWDQFLSIERAKHDHLTPELFERVHQLYQLALNSRVDAIMFTCSAFGEAIEVIAKEAPIPVLKPNQAMFDCAISLNLPVALLGTFAPAMARMEQEFLHSCNELDVSIALSSYCVSEARSALVDGNKELHNQLLTECVQALTEESVIMLAHFSSSIAKQQIEKRTGKRVLSSPECAVAYLKHRLTHTN